MRNSGKDIRTPWPWQQKMANLTVALRLQRNILKKLWDLNKLNRRYQASSIYLCLEYFLELFLASLLHASRFVIKDITESGVPYLLPEAVDNPRDGRKGDQVPYSSLVRTGHKRYPPKSTVSPV